MSGIDTRTREVLRQTSVALHASVVTVWEVSPRAQVVPVRTSTSTASLDETALDLDQTLHRWGTAVVQGSRWIGCRLPANGQWCVAPVRTEPPAPPPGGVERRSRERMTLEVAGLCVGLLERPEPPSRPRLPEADALVELTRQPSVIAHEVANPLTAALVSLDLCVERVRTTDRLDVAVRASLLDDLTDVAGGMERAIEFLRSIQDRARGALARSERFEGAQVVRACVTLERPLARKRGVAVEAAVGAPGVFLQGDPNALYQILTNLIRNAVTASQKRHLPVTVGLEQSDECLRLVVRDQGVGIAAEHRDRIFEPGFTTQAFGSGSGMGLAVVRHLTEEMFRGRVEVDSTLGQGSTLVVLLPIPPQRSRR